MANTDEIGSTLDFVTARGFEQVGQFTVLIGFDGTRRLFAELFADADRPDVRPTEAYKKMVKSLQPSWTIRILQIFWPDAEPRETFLQRLETWGNHNSEGLDILFHGLTLAVQQFPLPFLRRTFIEFVLPGEEGLAWWEGLSGVCGSYGVQVKYLGAKEIQELAYRIFNPGLGE